jgi:hypothetical protein
MGFLIVMPHRRPSPHVAQLHVTFGPFGRVAIKPQDRPAAKLGGQVGVCRIKPLEDEPGLLPQEGFRSAVLIELRAFEDRRMPRNGEATNPEHRHNKRAAAAAESCD